MAGTSNFTKRELFYGSVEDDRDQNYSVHTKGRKKLLVFGLGGLLCHRICRKDTTEVPIVHRRPDAVYGSYAGMEFSIVILFNFLLVCFHNCCYQFIVST